MHADELIQLRPIEKKDCRLLWLWANDPETRANSFSPAHIPWDRHVQWFESKFNDPKAIFFIALNDKNIPIGQVRFDILKKKAVISVSIAPDLRGKGYGSKIIYMASHLLLNSSDIYLIHAYIKKANFASTGAFITAGYNRINSENLNGHQTIHLILQRQN
ncbi:MAG: GNAT family N-acetyltransferase [Desulfobacterales bacterium]|nr:GNAT family N-acetyltransferase [Desulfobacterales bacterium]